MSSDGSDPGSSNDDGSDLGVSSCSNVNNKVMLLDNDKVMVCAACDNILIGFKCMKHHLRVCLHMIHSVHEETKLYRPHKAIGICVSGPPRWMDCGRDFPPLECSLQRQHPAWRKKKSSILAILRWVTLLRGVFCKDRLLAPLRMLSKTKNKISTELCEFIVTYLIFNLDDSYFGIMEMPSLLQQKLKRRRLPRWVTVPSY